MEQFLSRASTVKRACLVNVSLRESSLGLVLAGWENATDVGIKSYLDYVLSLTPFSSFSTTESQPKGTALAEISHSPVGWTRCVISLFPSPAIRICDNVNVFLLLCFCLNGNLSKDQQNNASSDCDSFHSNFFQLNWTSLKLWFKAEIFLV